MFEAYSVGVKIALVDGVTSGLRLMSRHFKMVDTDAARLEQRLKGIGKLTLLSAGLTGAGVAGLRLFKGPLEEAKAYQTELGRFASLGFGAAINAQADQFARGMRTIGTSTRDNLTLVTDAMAVFKNLHHAEMAAPILAQMKYANEVMFGKERGGANEAKFMDLLKVIEFRGGLSSPAEFARQADFAQKVITGSRGRVDATALLQALKTGGVALSRRANEQFYLGSEPLIQEFGGSRYGTAAMSIYQNLVQSRGTITAQQELYRLGLLDPSRVQFNKLGMLKRALPGAFTGSSILENQGELALLQQVLLPAFARRGITSPEGVTRELGMILGNRTGSGLMARIYQQMPVLQNQTAANRHAMGIRQLAQVAQVTAEGKEITLLKREADLKLHIGQQVLPIYVHALEALSAALGLVNMFPDWLMRIGTYAGVAGSTALIAAGGIAGLAAVAKTLDAALEAGGANFRLLPLLGRGLVLMATGIRVAAVAMLTNPIGLAVTAVVGLGVAAYELWKHWDTVGPALKRAWDAIYNGVVWFINKVIGLANYLPGVNITPIGGSGAAPNVIHTTRSSPQQLGHVFLDGRKVGDIMAPQLLRRMSTAASRPNQGASGFDGARGPLRPATAR